MKIKINNKKKFPFHNKLALLVNTATQVHAHSKKKSVYKQNSIAFVYQQRERVPLSRKRVLTVSRARSAQHVFFVSSSSGAREKNPVSEENAHASENSARLRQVCLFLFLVALFPRVTAVKAITILGVLDGEIGPNRAFRLISGPFRAVYLHFSLHRCVRTLVR